MIREILLANDSNPNGAGTGGDHGPRILFNEDDPRFNELGIVLHPELESNVDGQTAKSATKDTRHEHLRDYVRLAHLSGHRDGPIGPLDSTVLPATSAPANSNSSSNSHSHPNSKGITHGNWTLFNCGCDADTSMPSAYLPIDAREQDVLGPMHDELSRSPAWWIVDMLFSFSFVSSSRLSLSLSRSVGVDCGLGISCLSVRLMVVWLDGIFFRDGSNLDVSLLFLLHIPILSFPRSSVILVGSIQPPPPNLKCRPLLVQAHRMSKSVRDAVLAGAEGQDARDEGADC